MKSIQEITNSNPAAVNDERMAFIYSKIPARYRDADLEKCDIAIREWAYGPKDKDQKGLYLWGPVGTGKTYAAYALYKTLMVNNIPTRISNAAALLQDIRDDFKYSSRDAYYQSKFDGWVDYTGVLIIDDLGAEKPSEWALETFYTLVNTRYEAMRPILFTSNFSLEEIAGRLGDRIASRVMEMCTIMKLDGADRRLS